MRSLALIAACLGDWALHAENHGIGEKACQEELLTADEDRASVL